ncbi:MAG TPA: FMN-binding protein [Bacilli bacterium]
MRKKLIIFSLAFIFVIAFGIVYNGLVNNEKDRLNQKRAQQQFLDMYEVVEIKVDSLKENTEVEFLEEDDTKIIRRLDAYNKDKLVGIIYVGETKGRNEGLQVAFAIDVKKDNIVGMVFVQSNETPEYQKILTDNNKFLKQFLDKDMSAKKFTVEATSGATLTGNGINKIMQLVRAQYDADTDFETPAGIEFVSSRQDFTTLNFVYEFLADEETITVTTNQAYQIISISNEAYREDAAIEIEAHKMSAYITNIDGNNITIISKGFGGNLTTTATVENGNITAFETDISGESYDSSYNDLYQGGNVAGLFDDIINGNELEAVTGATVTSNAIIAAHNILLAYIEEVNTNE